MHEGIQLAENHYVIVDRREAIKFAVDNASRNDCVVILGKGHETGQEIMGKISPFDDRVELKMPLGPLGPQNDSINNLSNFRSS